MPYRSLYFRRDDGSKLNRYFIFDTEAELLDETLIIGDLAYTVDTDRHYYADSETTWKQIGFGGMTIKAGRKMVFDGD